MEQKDKSSTHFIFAVTITFMTLIIGSVLYNMNDRILMSKNIEQAIAKGVDPLSVRCSYQTTSDSICVAYSLKK
jgi:hypothetical protein